MKKYLSSIVLGALLVVPTVAHAQGEAPTTSNQPTYAVASAKAPQIAKVPSLERFEQIYKEHKAEEKVELTINIATYEDYKKAMIQVYTELPHKAVLKSKLKRSELKDFESKFHYEILVGNLPNYLLLANYSEQGVGSTLLYNDKTHAQYSAKTIEAVTKQFAKEFAQGVEGLKPIDKFAVIYDFVYQHYSYSATNYREMLVGNAPTGVMACNGFSRLMYELLNASGIETQLMHSDDHFYNQVKVADVFGKGEGYFTLDVTTDILLKTKHGATGLATKDYLNYVSKVRFYWATPVAKETKKPVALDSQSKNAITSINPQYALPSIHDKETRYEANKSTIYYHIVEQTSQKLKESAKKK